MKQATFEKGDRVRHRATQIEGEIVQMEESLAMPHAWVIEPSELEINAAKLYRLIDLKKLEDSGKGAEKTNQVQDVNPNISLCDREPELNSLTSNNFSEESVLTLESDSFSDREPKGDNLTSNDFSGESVLTVEYGSTTVSTIVRSPVLTVEQEVVALRCESLSGEHIASKPLPATVRSQSDTASNTSTSNELPRDKDTDQTNISLSKKGSEAEDNSTSNELLRDISIDQTNISLSKKGSEPEDNLTSNELLRDKDSDKTDISLSKNEVRAEDDLTPKQLPSDQGNILADLSPGKRRRYKGQGSGTISWRTLTKNGRDYHQPWYQYEFWDKGKCTLKSSKYIPKKLLQQVQQMNQAKVPVLEILEVLGVFGK